MSKTTRFAAPLLALAASCAGQPALAAELGLARSFADHAVLQRDQPIAVWDVIALRVLSGGQGGGLSGQPANRQIGIPAAAAGCGADTLGTARTLTLKREYGAWGAQQHLPLPLGKGEVVLTFDDGPRPETTPLVLKALADECVKATFFMVGDNIARFPDLARRAVREGHSAGMHSYAHRDLGTLTPADQLADLRKVQDIYQATFGKVAPAYRFPMLVETSTLMATLKAENVAVFSMDAANNDWQANVTTGLLTARLLESLKSSGGGIVLMHDAYAPPAHALPTLLKALKENGYRVVHLEWENQIRMDHKPR